MKFKFNGREVDSDIPRRIGTTDPVIMGECIRMRAGDTLQFSEAKFIAMEDGWYELPPGRGDYLSIFPIKAHIGTGE